jgi:hypothetical protein
MMVDLKGVEPSLPLCKSGVFPFDHRPIWWILAVMLRRLPIANRVLS